MATRSPSPIANPTFALIARSGAQPFAQRSPAKKIRFQGPGGPQPFAEAGSQGSDAQKTVLGS